MKEFSRVEVERLLSRFAYSDRRGLKVSNRYVTQLCGDIYLLIYLFERLTRHKEIRVNRQGHYRTPVCKQRCRMTHIRTSNFYIGTQ